MVMFYLANLINTFINFSPYVDTFTTPFANVEELLKRDDIVLGVKHGGSTLNFFRDSNSPVYKEVYEKIVTNPAESLIYTNMEGVEKVENEDNFAFFMESSSIDYVIARKCNLTRIGGLLDSKGYGIAMKKGNETLLLNRHLKIHKVNLLTNLFYHDQSIFKF